MKTIDALRQRLEVIQKDMEAIQAASTAAGKTVLDETEAASFDAKLKEFGDIESQIKREESLGEISNKLAAPQPKPRIEVVEPIYKPTNKNGGFKHFAEFLGAVRNAAFGRADPRLVSNAVTTYGGDNFGADGGFAVPPDFRAGIEQAWASDENLARLFNPIITNSNVVTLVTDETTPHASSGIQGSWTDEAGTSSPTKPVLKQINITLRKVQALVHLSDEILADASAIQSYVSVKMGAKLASLVSDSIVNGDGNGKPQGIMNSPAKVAFTRTTASKVKAEDVTGMVARLRPGSFGKSFWLVHSSVLPQLWTMLLGNMPVYAMNYKDSPFGTLLGRPIYVSEYCQVLGTSGDCILVNPEGYAFAQKAEGVQQAATIGFAFDQGLNSFRATLRCGGTPLLSGAIARKNGSDTLSDFVVIS
ncbi:MAG: phage major capsid protein [Deltaproteobacteria bacterium]